MTSLRRQGRSTGEAARTVALNSLEIWGGGKLKAEYDDLTTRGRIDIARKIEAARELGDVCIELVPLSLYEGVDIGQFEAGQSGCGDIAVLREQGSQYLGRLIPMGQENQPVDLEVIHFDDVLGQLYDADIEVGSLGLSEERISLFPTHTTASISIRGAGPVHVVRVRRSGDALPRAPPPGAGIR